MAALTDIPEGCNGIPRIQARTTSVSDFLENYERPYRPVIIQGVPEEEGWNASAKWQPSELYRNYADAKFKCGEDDDGYAVKIKMKYFLEYMRQQKDDSPLYVPPSQPSVLGGVSRRRRLRSPILFRLVLLRFRTLEVRVKIVVEISRLLLLHLCCATRALPNSNGL